ncbi:NRDE family protein [Granulosicoccaceae sp. 1_MG-2023]|nr:NRDE family protein [Granulosicoccaceae sp. 1_MG-2023]
MCLITFAYRAHPRYSLILVGNRDEFFARPAHQAHWWDEPSAIFGGRDLQQGGTWLALSRSGRFAAVTNYRDGRQSQEGKSSRGHVPLAFLQSGAEPQAFIADLAPRAGAIGGLNLLCGDSSGLGWFSNVGDQRQMLEPGVYGLSNAWLDTPWPKTRKATERLRLAMEAAILEPRSLMGVVHDQRPAADKALPDTGISREWEQALSAQFIRLDEYGTRATTVILQDYDGTTQFVEQSFDAQGVAGLVTETLHLPPLGGARG